MKIIFLNIWRGRMFDPLIDFIKQSSVDTDFFCLQEVTNSPRAAATLAGGRTNMFSEIGRALPEFKGYYAPSYHGHDDIHPVDYTLSEGQAIFWSADAPVESRDEVFVYKEKAGAPEDAWEENAPANLHCVRFRHDGKLITLANVHGIAYPGHKLDTPDRLQQSRRIAAFIGQEKGEKILGGDFNLMPETESIAMIERSGLRNLVKEYDIRTTRNELANGSYPEAERQYFADFTFASPGIEVKDFYVPSLLISDHLPLIVEIG